MLQIASNPELLGLLIVTVLNASLGFYVFFKDPTSPVSRIFLFLSTSIAAWCLVTFSTIYFYTDTFWYNLTDKLSYVVGLLIALSFYLFTVSYPYKSRSYSSKLIITFSLLTVIFSYLAFSTDLFVAQTFVRAGEIIIIHNPITYSLYSLLIVIPFGLGIRELWVKMKSGDGIYKQHFMTLMILVGSSIILSLVFDLLLSAFSNYTYVSVGPLSSVLLIFAIMRMIISKE